MRIIGGELRGHRLEAPPGQGTRPMLDRVRESLFQTLSGWLPGARVLDLFAGTGSLGFEAISRGANELKLVEDDPRVAELLRHNAEALGIRSKVTISNYDALEPRTWGTDLDVVFFDPPYPLLNDSRDREVLFKAIAALAREHLAPEGVIVFHTPKNRVREHDFPDGLQLARRTYGTNALWFIQAGEAETDG